MKVAVIKLGARISFSSSGTSGGMGETVAIIEMLRLGGATVEAYTKILDKDGPAPDGVTLHHIENEFENVEADALCILNGNANFFGGAEDRPQILNYHIINHFKGPVFYILCDPALTLKQLWPAVAGKEWGSKYKQEDIEITRKDIHYISQPYNTVEYLKTVNKGKNSLGITRINHYNFEKFPCLQTPMLFNPSPSIDLSYGGTMRGGRRADKMIKFYFGYSPDINVEMFGKINGDDFDVKKVNGYAHPRFTGAVKYDKMHQKMNDSLAHVVIGDKLYEETDDVPQRLAESVWSQVITFIDFDMDKARRIFGHDPDLAEFLYVHSRKDIEEKIRIMKSEPNARAEVLDMQMQAFNFDADVYCEGFVNLLKSL